MRKAWGLLLGTLLVGTAIAADNPGTPAPDAAAGATGTSRTARIEASMRVTGTLSVDATGATTGFTLDKREKLPTPVTQLLDGLLPTFRFKPVVHDGHAVAVETKMGLEVVAHQVDPQHIGLRLRSARFVEGESPMTERAALVHRVPLSYPRQAENAGVQGTVYLALRIDRTGHAADIEVQQVDLKYLGPDDKMQKWRDMLANNAIAGVRQFTFSLPTTGKHAHDAFVTGVLPVQYILDGGGNDPSYGHWNSYVPGPKREIAWLHDDDDDDDNGSSSRAVPEGEFAMTGAALHLLTPLDGG